MGTTTACVSKIDPDDVPPAVQPTLPGAAQGACSAAEGLIHPGVFTTFTAKTPIVNAGFVSCAFDGTLATTPPTSGTVTIDIHAIAVRPGGRPPTTADSAGSQLCGPDTVLEPSQGPRLVESCVKLDASTVAAAAATELPGRYIIVRVTATRDPATPAVGTVDASSFTRREAIRIARDLPA
ncbi:hypothetical protein R8Z50_30180 [Longispora sp. K20-0274]|uniref:hypothetical protein n=1 Tax=Longispora sp. K20-0274 TaxID=3088255 RepID=UPI00399C0308